MDDGKKKGHIGTIAIIVLVFFGIIADLLSLIPFVGDFVGPIFWVCAGIYFWKIGMGLLNGKRLATGVVSIVAELIPAVQALPTISVGIIAVIIMTRFEEKTGISVTSMTGKGTDIRNPLNMSGKRTPQIHVDNSESRPSNFNGLRAPGGGLR
jgi:hypothetical protein